jgi:hypothetical protein
MYMGWFIRVWKYSQKPCYLWTIYFTCWAASCEVNCTYSRNQLLDIIGRNISQISYCITLFLIILELNTYIIIYRENISFYCILSTLFYQYIFSFFQPMYCTCISHWECFFFSLPIIRPYIIQSYSLSCDNPFKAALQTCCLHPFWTEFLLVSVVRTASFLFKLVCPAALQHCIKLCITVHCQ